MPAPEGNQYNRKWDDEKVAKLADELIAWLQETDENGDDKGNIFFEDFLINKKGLYRDIIKYLSNENEYFKSTIERAKEMQEIKLLKFGVADRLQPTMTIFCLKNHHGYKDAHQLDHTNDGDKFNPETLSTEELIKRADAISRINKSE